MTSLFLGGIDILASKLDISKASNIPVGMEHSISNGILTVQPGYVKSNKGIITLNESLSTQSISDVTTGVENNVILGNVTTLQQITISSDTGKYLYYGGTGPEQHNSMVEDNGRGTWIFANSSQGTNNTTYPYYGFIFNDYLPAGNYVLNLKGHSSNNGNIYVNKGKGEIGNITQIGGYIYQNISNNGTYSITLTSNEPFNVFWIYYGNYNRRNVVYNTTLEQTISATKFNTYVCIDSDNTQYIKLCNDETQLQSYTDYAPIGYVLYKDTLTNPSCFPQSDLSNNWLSGNVATKTDIPDVSQLTTQVEQNTESLGGLKLVRITEQEYEELQQKDGNTLYIIE